VTTIIEQIQRDALDRSVRVSDLLRRVKLAATKLGLGRVEDWVEMELNGYNGFPVPEYRIVYGRPIARNPYTGWEPIGGSTKNLSVRHIVQSIASLEELANAPEGASITFPFSDEVVQKLNDLNGVAGWLAVLEVDRSTVVSILDRVRTLILDWALQLEQAGVQGTEFSFNAADKAKAQGAIMTINIGSIGSFAGNLGVDNTAGDISVREINLNQVRELTDQLKENERVLTDAGADGPTLKARLDELQAELRKAKPATLVLRGLLVDVRNAVAGAAGNLMASGAIALINQLLGTGVPAP
jgi:hypothetical protein